MSAKAGGFILALTFAIGMAVGNSGNEVETKYKVIHDTETVTKTVEVEVPGPIPTACTDAMVEARRISKAGSQFNKTNAELLSIMSETRIAVAMGDSNAINLLETRLRVIDGKTVGAIETLGDVNPDLDESTLECLKGIEDE